MPWRRRGMSPKCTQVGAIWKASSSLFALWIPASAGEGRGAKGMRVGEDQSVLRRTGEPRPKSASCVRPRLSCCLRTGLSISACPAPCWAPRAQGLQALDLSPRENPIQSIFGESELSFPLLPHEKSQTPASHPRYCCWKDGFLLRNKRSSALTLGKW